MTPSHEELPAPFADWPRPLGFVLSGGGAFGPIQVGMIRALTDRGIRPDVIVGSSVGALHGAALAAHADHAIDLLEDLWSRIDRRLVFGSRRSSIASLVRHRTLTDGGALGAIIEQHLGLDRFEDLGVTFAAVATDALSGAPRLLTAGPIRPALLASAAVPGLFPRVEIDGRLYVDGGVSANVPVRQALDFGARSVVVLDSMPPTLMSVLPRSLPAVLVHSASLMLRNQQSHDVASIAHRHRIAVLPSAAPADMGTFNFDHRLELIEASRRLTIKTLDAWCASPPWAATGR